MNPKDNHIVAPAGKNVIYRFVSTISRRGDRTYVITIPKEHVELVKHMWKKKVKVMIEEIPPEYQ